ncbi:sugar phosphate isomerase/epimerase family protein [Puniceicoccus vermicola]|uniref:Sugar phosphate isomerase/epimerase n=1 Tax=Puniceicoccus vermicola TaxID=388746 RepID=A0A7X1AZ39_9BACT|nr:TIM barrel protein [Puniceicoccus vermicola]MBC2602635.1 sugar phosphate isomerase/epimerase [Puniceicoccus vermicola]
MNWSFSTLGCPHRTLQEAFALARRYNLSSLEIRALNGNVNLRDNLIEIFGSPRSACGLAQSLPLPICSLDSSVRVIGPSQEDWTELEALAPWADALNVPSIRVFDGRPRLGDLQETHLQQVRDFFVWWNQKRDDHGWKVDVIVETHDILLTTEAIKRFQSILETPAKILWDTHHTWSKGEEDPQSTWQSIAPWVAHIHVKDRRKGSNPGEPETFALPGEGNFPFATLIPELEAYNFSGPVSLEWEKFWKPELPELSEALEACRRMNWWGSPPNPSAS